MQLLDYNRLMFETQSTELAMPIEGGKTPWLGWRVGAEECLSVSVDR